VSAIESPHLFSLIANPQKAKNDDKVTFLERISQKYLVTFGNFCNFAAHLANGRGVLLVLFRIKYINKEIGK
jgi:hypothetical protein